MAEEMHWYDSSTWKKALEMWVYDTGQWKEALRVYIWDAGLAAWRLCHISPNACFSFSGEPITSITDCATALTDTYHSNTADPYTAYTSFDTFLYDNTGCGSGAGLGAGFWQLDVGGTLYNFETNSSSKIIDAFVVNC